MAVRDGIAAALFNGVANGVAQIQQAALVLFFFVPFHHAGFVSNAPGDDLSRIGLQMTGLEQGEEALIRENPCLNGFSGAVCKDVTGQRAQSVRVAQDSGRLQEGSGQVLSSF